MLTSNFPSAFVTTICSSATLGVGQNLPSNALFEQVVNPVPKGLDVSGKIDDFVTAEPAVIELDHNYYALPPKIPFLSLSQSVPSSNKSTVNGAGVDNGGSSSSLASIASKASSKSKQSPIKYMLDNKKEKPKKGRGQKSNASSNSSKLESLLKAPSRRGSSIASSVSVSPSSSSTSPSPLLFDKIEAFELQNDEIDVVTPSPPPKIKYDATKARNLMHECEKFVNLARPNDVPENWESQIVKTGWTRIQKKLFEQTLRILHDDRLARLSFAGNSSEPVLRRLTIDKTAQRLRTLLTKISWDSKLTQWLHGILKDNLSWEYLASYLDILQTLRAKVPTLIDKMILLSTTAKSSPLSLSSPSKLNETDINEVVSPIFSHQSAEALNLLLKRKWDPFSTIVKQNKTRKLQCDPLFLLLPCAPSWGNPISNRRTKTFMSMLANIGKTIPVNVKETATLNASVDEYAEKLVNASRFKLHETRTCFPERPVFLIGWGSGAVIAARLSLLEKVAGIICLGFPLFTINGSKNGGHQETFLNIKIPSLFVIGDKARNTNVSLMDKFRQRLTTSSMLVVINGGDDFLNVKRTHKKRLLMTQTAVDKNIVDEVAMFISVYCNDSISTSILPNPYSYSSKLPTIPSVHSISSKKINSAPTSKTTYSILSSGSHGRTKMGKKFGREHGSTFDRQLFDDIDDYAEAKKVPSNTSSNRRKAYFRASNPQPASTASDKSVSASNMTASQLLQQIHHQADTIVQSKPDMTLGIAKLDVTSPTKSSCFEGLQKPLNMEISNTLNLMKHMASDGGVTDVMASGSINSASSKPLSSLLSTQSNEVLSNSQSTMEENCNNGNLLQSTSVNVPLQFTFAVKAPNNGECSSSLKCCAPPSLTTINGITPVVSTGSKVATPLTVAFVAQPIPATGDKHSPPEAPKLSEGFPRPLNVEISSTLRNLNNSVASPSVMEVSIPANPLIRDNTKKNVLFTQTPSQEDKSASEESQDKADLAQMQSQNGRRKTQLTNIRIDNVCSLAGQTPTVGQVSIPSLVPVITQGSDVSCNSGTVTTSVCALNPTDIEQLNKVLQAKGSDISSILASGKRIVLQKTLKQRSLSESNGPLLSQPKPSTSDSPSESLANETRSVKVKDSLPLEPSTKKGSAEKEEGKADGNVDKPLQNGDSKKKGNDKLEDGKEIVVVNEKPPLTFNKAVKRKLSAPDVRNHESNLKQSVNSNSNGSESSTSKRIKYKSLSMLEETSVEKVEESFKHTTAERNLESPSQISTKLNTMVVDSRRKRIASSDSKTTNGESEESAPIAKRTRMSDKHQNNQTSLHQNHNSDDSSNDVVVLNVKVKKNGPEPSQPQSLSRSRKLQKSSSSSSGSANKDTSTNRNSDDSVKVLRSRSRTISESDSTRSQSNLNSVNQNSKNNNSTSKNGPKKALRRRKSSTNSDKSNRKTSDGSSESTSDSNTDSDYRQDDDDATDSDLDSDETKKKHKKKIFPVTPASLSSTRTRKVSIPKFFAFGM